MFHMKCIRKDHFHEPKVQLTFTEIYKPGEMPTQDTKSNFNFANKLLFILTKPYLL